VLGAILLVLALLIFPVLVLMSGVVAAWAIGTSHTADAEARHAGSELVELNR
jgi:hypothetical protein